MPRHELAIASNISNTIHCIKLHELEVYSEHVAHN